MGRSRHRLGRRRELRAGSPGWSMPLKFRCAATTTRSSHPHCSADTAAAPGRWWRHSRRIDCRSAAGCHRARWRCRGQELSASSDPPAIIRPATRTLLTEPYNSLPKSGNPILIVGACGRCIRLATMAVTVLLELKFKPDAVPAARDLMRRTLETTRGFDGNLRTDMLVDEDDEAHWIIYELWDTVEHDEAYRA